MCMLPETELTCCQRNGFKHGCEQGDLCPEWGRASRKATDEALDAFGPAPRRFINFVPFSMFVYEWLADAQWFAVARALVFLAGIAACLPLAWFLAKLLWALVVSSDLSLP